MSEMVLYIALAFGLNDTALRYRVFKTAEEACSESFAGTAALKLTLPEDGCAKGNDFKTCLDYISKGKPRYEIKTMRCYEGKSWHAQEMPDTE